LNRRNRDGWPALMEALHADQPAAATALLEWGADPDGGDDSGYTPLMLAAGRGDPRTVAKLLEHGADPRAELFLGFTALDYAIGYGHREIVRLLLAAAPDLKRRRNGARRAVLALAGYDGDSELLGLLR
jgi:ankyrin repeat protein